MRRLFATVNLINKQIEKISLHKKSEIFCCISALNCVYRSQ